MSTATSGMCTYTYTQGLAIYYRYWEDIILLHLSDLIIKTANTFRSSIRINMYTSVKCEIIMLTFLSAHLFTTFLQPFCTFLPPGDNICPIPFVLSGTNYFIIIIGSVGKYIYGIQTKNDRWLPNMFTVYEDA